MKKGDIVKLVKLSAVESPRYPTPESSDYVAGTDNGDVSLPVEYTMDGILQVDVEVGKALYLFRSKRNEVPMLGVARTSVITHIFEENGITSIHTQNSIYQLNSI